MLTEFARACKLISSHPAASASNTHCVALAGLGLLQETAATTCMLHSTVPANLSPSKQCLGSWASTAKLQSSSYDALHRCGRLRRTTTQQKPVPPPGIQTKPVQPSPYLLLYNVAQTSTPLGCCNYPVLTTAAPASGQLALWRLHTH